MRSWSSCCVSPQAEKQQHIPESPQSHSHFIPFFFFFLTLVLHLFAVSHFVINHLTLSFILPWFLPSLFLISSPLAPSPSFLPSSLWPSWCLFSHLFFLWLFLTYSIFHPRGMQLSWCTLHWLISATWPWPRPWRWAWGETPTDLLAQEKPSLSKLSEDCLDVKCWCLTVMRYRDVLNTIQQMDSEFTHHHHYHRYFFFSPCTISFLCKYNNFILLFLKK